MKQFPLALALSVWIGGCSAQIEMFPVEGPLAGERPLPIAHAVADGVTGNSGRLTISLANGEKCIGRWSSVAPRTSGVVSGSLMTQYGSIAGFTAAQSGIAPGINRGEAIATCPSGNLIEAEFFTGSGTANGYGIARDSNGNVYRMLF